MPDVELGINDMWRQGKEVVGRHDIIPVVTEEWIRLENVEFHTCVQQDEYEKSRIIKYVGKQFRSADKYKFCTLTIQMIPNWQK